MSLARTARARYADRHVLRSDKKVVRVYHGHETVIIKFFQAKGRSGGSKGVSRGKHGGRKNTFGNMHDQSFDNPLTGLCLLHLAKRLTQRPNREGQFPARPAASIRGAVLLGLGCDHPSQRPVHFASYSLVFHFVGRGVQGRKAPPARPGNAISEHAVFIGLYDLGDIPSLGAAVCLPLL